MGLIARKPVLMVIDQIRLTPVCPATKTSQSIETLNESSLTSFLSRYQITKTLTKALISVNVCTFVIRMQLSQVFSRHSPYNSEYSEQAFS